MRRRHTRRAIKSRDVESVNERTSAIKQLRSAHRREALIGDVLVYGVGRGTSMRKSAIKGHWRTAGLLRKTRAELRASADASAPLNAANEDIWCSRPP